MNKYTIYCTEEQTKRALDLGAPIEFETLDSSSNFGMQYPVTPTAEQMLGWLEDQGIWEISIYKTCWTYSCTVSPLKGKRINCHGFKSRKEATIAAIDTALDYLSHKK